MNNYNSSVSDLFNQKNLNEVNSKKIEKSREKELEKKIFESSPILRNSPRPVKIYKERNVMRALFAFLPPITKQSSVVDTIPSNSVRPIEKFLWLYKFKSFIIDPPSRGGYDLEGINFREITSKNEQAREEIEEICVKEFVRVLEKKYLVEKLCDKIDYQSEIAKDFEELKIEDSQCFFDNLFKYIDKLGDTKDILIIANREICRFVKKHDANKVLERSVSNILETDYLENNIKLIMVSQKGLLIPYWISHIEAGDINNVYHYLNISYEIDLMDNNPIMVFKGETSDKR